MAGDVARIESKLARLVSEKNCGLCRTRVEMCPECQRPIGGLPGVGEAARHRVMAEIERLAQRRARIVDQLDGDR